MQELPDSALIALVQGNDPASRARAIYRLGERKATAAVLPLIEAMEDASLRPAVAGALARMKAEAVPVLLRLLESPDPRHRRHAACMLGEFRTAAVVPALVPLLGDLSRDVHTAAFEALGRIGEDALGALRGAARNPDPNVRIGIANALGRMAAPVPPGRETPASLEDLLEDEAVTGCPEEGTRGIGGSGLSESTSCPAGNGHPALSPGNRELVVSLLRQLLDDENSHVRDAAAAALHHAGGPPDDAVFEGIDSPDPRIHKEAIRKLGQGLLFRGSGAAIPPLIEALFDEDPEIRVLAARSLRYADDPRIVMPLNACLLDVSPDVRQEAAEALRRRKDPRVLEPLIHALGDESPGVRRVAASALGELGNEKARDPLMHCGNDTDRLVREAAARALAMLGPDPRLDPHVLVRSPDPELRAGAVTGLGKGREADDLGLITGALDDEDARVRRAAAEALCGFSDPAAVPALLNALSDTDGHVRMYALRALQEMGDPRVRLPLIYALRDADAMVRTEAVAHLRNMGDDEAVPYLIEALGDPDTGVCREAVFLLGNIGGERTGATLRDLEQRTHDPLKLAAIRTALDQISRMNNAGPGARGEPFGAGAADRPGPARVSPMNNGDASVRGEPYGAGAAERVVISRKKNVEPAHPHTRMVTPRAEPGPSAGDFRECLPLLETDPPAARVWKNLVDTAGDYLEKGNFAAAKPLLENAWDIWPDSELLVTRLGLTLSGLGLYEEALSVYRKGLAINPRNDAFWSNAGALLANLECYDEALRSYKQALALCMSDEKIWYQTGIVLNNLGRYAEAVKCFDRALLLNPAFAEAVEAGRIARGNVQRG